MSNFDLPVTLVSPKGREEVVDNFERANNLLLTCGYVIKREEPASEDEAAEVAAQFGLEPADKDAADDKADEKPAEPASTTAAGASASKPKTAASAKPKDDTK